MNREQIEKALEPFAKMADRYNERDVYTDRDVILPPHVHVGDFRRASAALSALCEEQSGRLRTREEIAEDEVSEAEQALAEFAKHTNWSLSHKAPIFCDDDDQTERWEVIKQTGNYNDREWHVIGFGSTPTEALIAARRAREV